MITYVDASVVLRIILAERGPLSDWREIDPVSSELVQVECLRTIDRARSRGIGDNSATATQRAAVQDTLASFSLVPITPSVLERAADPFPTALGTLDAIHLATALALRADRSTLRFATHDIELANAARSMGFDVLGN